MPLKLNINRKDYTQPKCAITQHHATPLYVPSLSNP